MEKLSFANIEQHYYTITGNEQLYCYTYSKFYKTKLNVDWIFTKQVGERD